MQRAGLAKKLVAAKNATERKHLLAENRGIADARLALALKDLCYAAWTTGPTGAQKAAGALESLYKFNPDNEIGAYRAWVCGISEITRGRLEQAVKWLDDAARIFIELNREHESAQTQVAKLIALALLGRYDEAVTTGERALRTFEKYDDELAAGKVEKNLGNIVSRLDQHKRAEKYYLSAIGRFEKLRDPGELTSAQNGLAITYTHLNDFRQAEKAFAVALEGARMSGMLMIEAGIEASMGNLALFRGRYDEALRYFELSRRKYDELNMPHQTAVAGLEIADIYRELNLTQEAFEIYGDVADTLSELKMQGDEARARANFGRAAIALGERTVARSEMKKAARLYEREGNNTGAAAVKLAEARLEISAARRVKALDILTDAERLLSESDSSQYGPALMLLRAEACEGERSEAILLSVLANAKRNEQPHFELAALNLLGRNARSRGAAENAISYFKSAIALVEKLRAPLAAEEFRMSFLSDKLEPFENLAGIYLSEGNYSEAFLYTERSRARSLAEIVTTGSIEGFFGDFSDDAERLNDAREELNWYYSRLQRAAAGEIATLQAEAGKREKQIASLMRRQESTRKREGRDKTSFLDLNKLHGQLGKDRVLVEFIERNGVFSAFVVDENEVNFVDGLATREEILADIEGLQFQFGAMRYGKNLPERFAAQLKAKADVYLEKLYGRLLAPIEEKIGRHLLIVPVGVLYYMPFQALRCKGRYLVEEHEVLYCPSAAVWQALSERPERDTRNALLIGYADENIPLVGEEIKALREVLPAPMSLTGKAATFAAYTKNAPAFDLLHLACHGQFRADNPMFSSLHLADGWVTVKDICAQRLNAGLVTLSACETGLNKIYAGDEIIGLARGFLSAGAASMVMSLWTVNDEATTRLMQAFYKNLQRGKTVAASLGIAQREFIARGEHPYFWSPFVVTGK